MVVNKLHTSRMKHSKKREGKVEMKQKSTKPTNNEERKRAEGEEEITIKWKKEVFGNGVIWVEEIISMDGGRTVVLKPWREELD